MVLGVHCLMVLGATETLTFQVQCQRRSAEVPPSGVPVLQTPSMSWPLPALKNCGLWRCQLGPCRGAFRDWQVKGSTSLTGIARGGLVESCGWRGRNTPLAVLGAQRVALLWTDAAITCPLVHMRVVTL